MTGHPYPPLFRNLHFENIRCRKARKCAFYSVGIASRPIRGVYLDSVTVVSAAAAAEIANTRDLRMRNVRVNGRDLAHR